MIEGSLTNPFKAHMQMFKDANKYFYPTEHRSAGRLTWFEMSPHREEEFRESLLNVQNACLPVLSQLRNIKNLGQLQQRIYLALKKYQTAYNVCIIQARNARQADYCAQQLITGINVDFRPELKQILSEY